LIWLSLHKYQIMNSKKQILTALLLVGITLPGVAQTARVQVIHNSADAAASVVDIYVNNALALNDFAFRTATPFINLPANANIIVGVAPANSMDASDVIASFPLGQLAENGSYVIMATGLLDAINYNPFEAFTLNVFPMGQEAAMMAGNTDVLVYHGGTDAPSVDVNEIGVGAGQIINNMSYGDWAGNMYLELPTLDFILDVTLADGTPTGLQYEAPLASLGLDGAALIVFASGFLNTANNNDGPSFGLWVALPDGTTLALPEWNPTARVQVIHNSADAAASVVDIYLNGNLAVNDFAFRTATAFLDLPAYDTIEIGVAPGNSMDADDIIATFPFILDANGSYIVMATGLLDAINYNPFEAFTLNVFPMGQETAMMAGNTDVLVYHGGTDAPSVDVNEIGVGAGQIINNMSYGDWAGNMYLELPTLDFILDVTLADGTPTGLQYEAPLASLGLDGAALIVFASGFLNTANNNDGPSFGLWVALPDGTTLALPEWNPTARVQVIHNSADALAAEVDVYINGALAIDDFAFRTATAFLDLPAYNTIEIGVAPGNSMDADDIIATFPFQLEEDETYIVVANGLLDAVNYDPFVPFDLYVFTPGREVADNNTNTDILVFHGSTDAPTVDLYEVGLPAGELIDNLSYGDFGNGDYLELANDNYYVQVRLADGTTPVVTYNAPLETLGLDGAAAVAFASGFLNPANNNDGAPFEVWVALPDGTTLALPALGAAPVNNVCTSPEAINVGEEVDCANNSVIGDLSNAWNDFGTPDCELTGVIPTVYYTFNTGSFDEITIDITAGLNSGPEIGYLLLEACGTMADGVDTPCSYNTTVIGPVTVVGLEENTDYILMIFSNLDFANTAGEFTLCVSGDDTNSITENNTSSFNLFPNPNNGSFNIEFKGTEGMLSIDVLNLDGRIVASESLVANTGSRVDMNLDLASGVYMIRMIDENGKAKVQRFIVE